MRIRLFTTIAFLLSLFIVQSCEEASTGPEEETTGTVTDIDGNEYLTIQIGDQEWLAENLKVTHYRNGEAIPNVTDATEWSNLTTGAYCEYDNSRECRDLRSPV